MVKNSFIKILIAGNLTRDFIINTSGKAYNNIPGGSLFFAAAGARLWNDSIGLIGRIGDDYPQQWIQEAEKRGVDTRGIIKVPQSYDIRKFLAWRDSEYFESDNPVAHYAKFGLTFPHDLLGYHLQTSPIFDSRWANITTKASESFPQEYLDTTAIHLCPMDFFTHVKLPNYMQHGSVNTVTLSPSDQYMNAANLERIPAVIKGLTAFFPTESQVNALFQGQTKDIWEMAESLSEFGCPYIVILRGDKGYWMYDASAKKRIIVPPYPTKWLDPTGANDVFCGAFLGEYKNSYDPIQAAIYGSVATSFAVEGSGAFYCLDRLPGLEKARVDSLRPLVKIL